MLVPSEATMKYVVSKFPTTAGTLHLENWVMSDNSQGPLYVRMYVHTYRRVYICMYVCIYCIKGHSCCFGNDL